MREIGQLKHPLVAGGFRIFRFFIEFRDPIAQFARLFLLRFGFLGLFLPHERANLLGDTVPLRFQRFDFSDRFPTSGPENRFDTILFVEKEGFEPLFRAAAIAQRFESGIMSTKGMSVTAARLLIDRLASQVQRILVLRDFDVTAKILVQNR